MKILIDMNLSPLWVDTFAKHAIEAIHWSSIGDPRTIDSRHYGMGKHQRLYRVYP